MNTYALITSPQKSLHHSYCSVSTLLLVLSSYAHKNLITVNTFALCLTSQTRASAIHTRLKTRLFHLSSSLLFPFGLHDASRILTCNGSTWAQASGCF